MKTNDSGLLKRMQAWGITADTDGRKFHDWTVGDALPLLARMSFDGSIEDHRAWLEQRRLVRLYRTAVHEAGHAVMALRLDVSLDVATIVPAADSSGHLLLSLTDDERDRHVAEYSEGIHRHPQIDLAGWGAMVAARLPNPQRGCEDDFAKARTYCAAARLPYGAVKRRVKRMMRWPANRKAVAAVTALLMRQETVYEEEITRALWQADGVPLPRIEVPPP